MHRTPRTLRRLLILGMVSWLMLPVRAADPSRPPVLALKKPDERPIVWVLNGAGDLQGCSNSLYRIIATEGYPLELTVFNWSHGYRRVMIDQLDYRHAREQGKRLARTINERMQQEPQRRVVLVAHSAGCAVALAAAELLPKSSLDRIVLMAPSVSIDYNPIRAAYTAREGMDVFCSERDIWALGIGTRLVGTTDNRRAASAAGRYGFQMRDVNPDHAREWVRQYFWTREQEWTGHNGGHYGAYTPGFARLYVLPKLAGEPMARATSR